MKPFFIFGAGAVGSALAGYLARAGHPVTLLAREPHAQEIVSQKGLRVRSRSETFLAPVAAVTAVPERLSRQTALFITVKAQDVTAAVAQLGDLPRQHDVVTWQNGIRAEEEAAPRCPDLYGGVVRFTSTMLKPGEVRLREPGGLIVGRHPSGPHPGAEQLVHALSRAGFTAVESPDIAADKALKLFVNLVSGPAVLMHRTGPEPALAQVQVALLEEADRVFRAAGIRVFPAAGLGPTVEALLDHFRAGGTAPDTRGGVYNSTWQSLHYRHRSLENAFYHGEVIALGEQQNISTPVNRRVLAVLQDVHKKQLGPEPFSPEAFRSRFTDVLDLSDLDTSPPPAPEDTLEI